MSRAPTTLRSRGKGGRVVATLMSAEEYAALVADAALAGESPSGRLLTLALGALRDRGALR